MNIVWATRGRSWGFRFLLDGGFDDPLAPYEAAFEGTDGQVEVCQRVGGAVALRFPDPLGRRDAAGRPIPQDFVLLGRSAAGVRSVEDGIHLVWPVVSDAYARVWDLPSAPTAALLRGLIRQSETANWPDTADPGSR